MCLTAWDLNLLTDDDAKRSVLSAFPMHQPKDVIELDAATGEVGHCSEILRCAGPQTHAPVQKTLQT